MFLSLILLITIETNYRNLGYNYFLIINKKIINKNNIVKKITN